MEFQNHSTEFDPYIREANILVDAVINNALAINEEYLIGGGSNDKEDPEELRHNAEVGRHNAEVDPEEKPEEETVHMDTTGAIPNIKWLTGKEFTIEAGKNKIDEFLKTWERDAGWLYCIDYLGKEEHDCDFRYRYKVMWSIPTRRKPIPRATASVYFTMKVNKFKPKTFPVDVYYIFETNTLVHRPGECRFQQKWLKDIIDSKIILIDGVKF
ncbi:A-kinase anchor protein 14-like [Rhopilema esculentum]|uniref:A-kinase anchor protein 14-like n=1 Tax=Rhopilema esculentum TaxID=499914 RepID=UPI0031CFEA8B